MCRSRRGANEPKQRASTATLKPDEPPKPEHKGKLMSYKLHEEMHKNGLHVLRCPLAETNQMAADCQGCLIALEMHYYKERYQNECDKHEMTNRKLITMELYGRLNNGL
jgi:hypothetical protein